MAESIPSPHSRAGIADAFRRLREAAGWSPRELAAALGTSTPAIHDLESQDDEMFRLYSPREVSLIAAVLGTDAVTLLHCPTTEPPISGSQLLEMIQRQLAATCKTLTSFENRAGWRLEPLLDSPDHLLADLTVEALQWLGAALGIDWRRVIAGLPTQSDPAP
jgi:transcriptional regulator with XRE-family HTH domain